MEQNTDSVEVQYNSETVEVPLSFDRSDLAAWFGDVPESFDVDRVFTYEGNVRAEAYLGNGHWVEAVYQTEDSAPVFNASELGWVADKLEAPEDSPEPGETVWEA